MRFIIKGLAQQSENIFSIGNANLCAQALAICEVVQASTDFHLVVTPDSASADILQRHINFFLEDKSVPVNIFPDWEILPYDTFSPHQDIISQRMRLLYSLASHPKGIVIVSCSTLMHRLVPANYIQRHCLFLKTGDIFDISVKQKQLTQAGYINVETVFNHGEFSLRGSLMDIFPMGASEPVRIDLFDNTIDSIRTFDPESQFTQKVIGEVQLLPAHEYPLTPNETLHFKQSFQDTFDVDFRECPVYCEIAKGYASAGAEYYLPLFFDSTETLFDYLPKKTAVITTGDIQGASEKFWKNTVMRYENHSVDTHRPLLPPSAILLATDQLFSEIKSRSRLRLTCETITEKQGRMNLPVKPFPEMVINVKASDPYFALTSFLNTNNRVLFVAESAGRREQLLTLLANAGVKPEPVASWNEFISNPEIKTGLVIAPLDYGLWFYCAGIALITESEFLGSTVMQRRRRGKQTQISDQVIRNLSELNNGSPVVHISHGVGRFEGLQTFNLDGQPQEFLTLLYADNAKLYVPVAHLHLISRYTGASDENAPLHKLGSDQWGKARKKSAEKVRDVAAELLDIYARRRSVNGESFSWPEAEYITFCNEFPFETTPDQQATIEATLEDLEKAQPMDRLVCGDVGFGKTEVAMRAAFATLFNQAKGSQKQVAILAPTTLLAQQHYESFCDRFADWPVKVAVISRFKSAKQTVAIKQALASGDTDIIIGTHKLLNENIRFKDLGLLVIDEEHRFGVRQKERMKSFRSQVNILTLTATPIPRTLNMAMSSIRDLSIIATPPAKRLSINTFVHNHENRIIKEAVHRELLRGGQVYYLHNDVKTIEKAADDLQELVPDARVAIGHGQMRERQLEQVMHNFYHRKTNVLVCSTIIETGIDVPNANTIVIHRADKFGLAQLHQLRGRVGRSCHQAYAYLLTPKDKKITKDAEKRLEVIASTTALGSGFMLATHDLEIRGAGELLGEGQSGQITNIGFSLYMDMLEKAVKSLQRGDIPKVDVSVDSCTEVNLHIPALIPENYIASPHTRLILYKRIASCETADMLDELKVEFIDRFGLLPEAVTNLFRVTKIKLKAEKLAILKIVANSDTGKITFSVDAKINPENLIALIQQQPNIYQLIGSTALKYTSDMHDFNKRFSFTEQLLEHLF